MTQLSPRHDPRTAFWKFEKQIFRLFFSLQPQFWNKNWEKDEKLKIWKFWTCGVVLEFYSTRILTGPPKFWTLPKIGHFPWFWPKMSIFDLNFQRPTASSFRNRAFCPISETRRRRSLKILSRQNLKIKANTLDFWPNLTTFAIASHFWPPKFVKSTNWPKPLKRPV